MEKILHSSVLVLENLGNSIDLISFLRQKECIDLISSFRQKESFVQISEIRAFLRKICSKLLPFNYTHISKFPVSKKMF